MDWIGQYVDDTCLKQRILSLNKQIIKQTIFFRLIDES